MEAGALKKKQKRQKFIKFEYPPIVPITNKSCPQIYFLSNIRMDAETFGKVRTLPLKALFKLCFGKRIKICDYTTYDF